jgi:hypothetical protein
MTACYFGFVLSPKTQYNLRKAKRYFEEHLLVGDYYNEGERVGGDWFGKGAEFLGSGRALQSLVSFLSWRSSQYG